MSGVRKKVSGWVGKGKEEERNGQERIEMENGETKKMGEGKKMRVSFDGKNKKVDKTDEAQSNRNIILASSCCAEASRSLKSWEILTSKDAASFLRLSLSSFMNMVSAGQIPVYKIGRRNRYLRSELFQLFFQNHNKDKEN